VSSLNFPACKGFAPLLHPLRYKGAYGGRGSGKSHFFAEAAVERCVHYPGTRVVCVREIQRSLKESVKRLIEDKIETLGVGDWFNILSDRIITQGGGVILFPAPHDHRRGDPCLNRCSA
jgi:phage terminase large subunit